MIHSSSRKKVLMLGWEFPPLLSGGLGVACEGLAHALSPLVHLELILPTLSSSSSQLGSLPFAVHTLDLSSPPSEPFPPSFPVLPPPPSLSLPLAFTQSFSPYDNGAGSLSPDPYNTYERQNERPSLPSLYSGSLLRRVHTYTSHACHFGCTRTFDLIHAHDWMTFPTALELKKVTGKPLILHLHSTQYDRMGPQDRGWIFSLERQACQEADQIITVSQYTADLLQTYYEIPADKIQVVHNGSTHTNEPREADNKHSMALKKRLSSAQFQSGTQTPTCLFLGRITPQKGPEIFLDFAECILTEFPSAQFLIGGEGSYEDDLQSSISRRKLHKQVRLLGFLDNAQKQHAFEQSDLFILPSSSEPFGIVALEAAQQGLPVILSQQSGIKEVLPSAPCLDFFDIQGFFETACSLLRNSAMRNRLSERLYQEAQSSTWSQAANHILALYQNLTNKP